MPAEYAMFCNSIVYTIDANVALLTDPIELEDRLLAVSIQLSSKSRRPAGCIGS